MNPDLHLIKASSLNRALLIYNSQRSDLTSQQELAAATEIFPSKDVAQFCLGSTKIWVSAADLCAVFATFIWRNLSKEQAKEIKVKGNNGRDFSLCSSQSMKEQSRPQITSPMASDVLCVQWQCLLLGSIQQVRGSSRRCSVKYIWYVTGRMKSGHASALEMVECRRALEQKLKTTC